MGLSIVRGRFSKRGAEEARSRSKPGALDFCLTLEYTVYTQYIDMHSSFVISQSDGRPMYLQIMEQIKQRVAVGEWARGQEIPSIRQLAVALRVSVITVKRAYLELEREGVIVTQHGKGSIVAPDPGLGDRLHDEELAQHIEQAARLGALLGLGSEELAERLQEATDKFMAGRLTSTRTNKERL